MSTHPLPSKNKTQQSALGEYAVIKERMSRKESLRDACRLLSQLHRVELRQSIAADLAAILKGPAIDTLCDDWEPLFAAVKNTKLSDDADLYETILTLFAYAMDSSNGGPFWNMNVAPIVCDVVRNLYRKTVSPDCIEKMLKMTFRFCEQGMRHSFFDIIPVLPHYLNMPSAKVQVVSACCVQVLCVGSLAMESFLCAEGCVALGALLHSGDVAVVRRVCGALHAMSTDLNWAKEMCESGLVPSVVHLLDCQDPHIVASAAGILQNVGREKSSAAVLLQSKTVELIVPLLCSNEPALQAAAVGVIVNLHQGSEEQRAALIAVVRSAVLLEALSDVMDSFS